MKILYEEGKQLIPIKLWLDDIEEGAMQQVINLSNLPFAFKHIAVMPDSHQGYGMPIGGVLATQGVVIPNAVGVDIGCGMCALKTSLKELDKETIKKIFGGSKEYQGGLRSCIPVGFNHHSKKQDESLMPLGFEDVVKIGMTIIERQYESALKQIGTLGGGNHFIELQKGSDGFIWVMIHRKGATLARQDTIGIIPGSQGTKSYIVKGLGNEESFMSCSHGAGRKMSRTKAQNELNLEEEIRKLDEKGIIHSVRHKNDLDEASGAYKDIDVVMNNQKDLVEILVELTPLAVIKG
jgi:RNA-splicing ligase RtcB